MHASAPGAPLQAAIKRRLTAWMSKRDGRGENPVVLTQRRIFILPTAQGLFFVLVLFALLIASINYNLSLGYVFTFLLGAMGLISMLHAFRNLARLEVSAGKAEPAFAGARALFHINLHNPTGLPRHAIGLKYAGRELSFADVARNRSASIVLSTEPPRRGWFEPGRFTLFTRYPLGLFYAWSNVQLGMRCLVYPRLESGAVSPPPADSPSERGKREIAGDDDFAGFKQYRPGDAPSHIAWKALARERGLLTKHFASPQTLEWWLDWNSLGGLDTEARLSRLTRWALDAHALRASFGVRLPRQTIAPNSGEQHLESVLRALALHELSGTKNEL